jgi:Tol biopolymer transport system component
VKRPLLAILLLATLACGDEERGDPNDPSVVLLGRVERSAIVDRRIVIEGDTIPDSLVTWSATDPSRITLLDSARIRFDSAGPLTLLAIVGGDTLRRSRTIPKPPVVYFDQVGDSGNRDLWRVELDGMGLTRITSDVADDRDPTVGGGELTFISFRGGQADLWKVGLNGGTASRITNDATEEMDPAVSKDGGKLAYTRLMGGLPKLYRGALGGPVAVTSSFSDGAVDGAPSWSPDGGKLAFISSQGGPVRLWVATITGGALDTLPGRGTSGADVEPAWSPDGRAIAFASSREGPTEIHLLTVATGVVTRLTTAGGSNGRPAWTADGRIIFVRWVDGKPELRWLDPATPAIVHEIPVGDRADHPASPW